MSERLALETIAHCCLSSIIPSQHSYSMTMIHHYSITHSNTHNFPLTCAAMPITSHARAPNKFAMLFVGSKGVNVGSKFARLLGTRYIVRFIKNHVPYMFTFDLKGYTNPSWIFSLQSNLLFLLSLSRSAVLLINPFVHKTCHFSRAQLIWYRVGVEG